MELTILTNTSGYLQDIEEQKQIWIDNLLRYLGFNLDKIRKPDGKVPADFFTLNDLQILSYAGTNIIRVFKGLDLIGEFLEPEFKLKKDENGVLYYEIKIKTRDIIEENIQSPKEFEIQWN